MDGQWMDIDEWIACFMPEPHRAHLLGGARDHFDGHFLAVPATFVHAAKTSFTQVAQHLQVMGSDDKRIRDAAFKSERRRGRGQARRGLIGLGGSEARFLRAANSRW